tara:strand:+ start:363 stop:776 length:414 start_codon:yes stop_codon:yes gene_type:complete
MKIKAILHSIIFIPTSLVIAWLIINLMFFFDPTFTTESHGHWATKLLLDSIFWALVFFISAIIKPRLITEKVFIRLWSVLIGLFIALTLPALFTINESYPWWRPVIEASSSLGVWIFLIKGEYRLRSLLKNKKLGSS